MIIFLSTRLDRDIGVANSPHYLANITDYHRLFFVVEQLHPVVTVAEL